MKKTLAVMLCALLLCFAFTSCRNVYIPADMIPGFGEEQISEEEAASAVAAYIDQFDFNKIKNVGTPLLDSFIEDAKTQLETDLGIDIDAVINAVANNNILEILQVAASLVDNDILSSAEVVTLIGCYSDNDWTKATPILERVICNNILPSLQKATGTYGVYSIKIRDFGGVTQDAIENVLSVLLEATEEDVTEDFSVTLAVDCSELDSSLFKSTSYAYSGTLYFTIDFSVVNDPVPGGDVYIDFDKITANTERALQTTESGERHRIRIDGVSAELPWTLGKGAGFDLVYYDTYFKPLEVGTVRYDSTAVPFSMILPLTDNV